MTDTYIQRDGDGNITADSSNPNYKATGHTPTYVSSTAFTVVGDLTSYYASNRTLRISDQSTQTFNIIGKVSGQAYDAGTDLTTVTFSPKTPGSIILDGADQLERGFEVIDTADADYLAYEASLPGNGTYAGTATTTGATITTLVTIPLSDDSNYVIKGFVHAKNTSDNTANVFEFIVQAYRHSGGSATIEGTVTSVYSIKNDAASSATFTASGNNILLQWTGVAATNFDVSGCSVILSQQ